MSAIERARLGEWFKEAREWRLAAVRGESKREGNGQFTYAFFPPREGLTKVLRGVEILQKRLGQAPPELQIRADRRNIKTASYTLLELRARPLGELLPRRDGRIIQSGLLWLRVRRLASPPDWMNSRLCFASGSIQTSIVRLSGSTPTRRSRAADGRSRRRAGVGHRIRGRLTWAEPLRSRSLRNESDAHIAGNGATRGKSLGAAVECSAEHPGHSIGNVPKLARVHASGLITIQGLSRATPPAPRFQPAQLSQSVQHRLTGSLLSLSTIRMGRLRRASRSAAQPASRLPAPS